MELEGALQLWLHKISDAYNRTLREGDPRTSSWFLMDSPWPTLSLCVTYAFFVKVLGPRLMQNRQPLNIRWLMVIYNFFMVIVSTLIFGLLGVYGWFGSYNWYCQPVDYSDTREAILMTHLTWWYFVSKFVEFTDTVFFVLRKKFTHISTLHIIHHGMMPMSVWWGVKFTPGGHSTFFAFVNSLVHIPMYFYYGLSAIGPHMRKYLWWKQYMTIFQMIQFVAIFVHSFQLLFRPDCEYPRGFMWWIGIHAIMFWFLFADFYKDAYLTRRKPLVQKITKSSGAVAGFKDEQIDEIEGRVESEGIRKPLVANEMSARKNNSFLNGYCFLGDLRGMGKAKMNTDCTYPQYACDCQYEVEADGQPRNTRPESEEKNERDILMTVINRYTNPTGKRAQSGRCNRNSRSSVKMVAE